jgi:ABC-2 type transport system permease protein
VIGAFVAELRKTAKRPAVWMCLGVVLALLVAIGYAVVWFVYGHPPRNFEQSLPRGTTIADLKATLYPLHFYQQVLGFSGSLGSAIALVLGVLSVGSEYGWNTLKTLFSQRPGRLTVLAAKFACLIVVMLVFAVAMMLAAALASLAAAGLDGGDITFPAARTIVKAALATWLMFTVWAFFGGFFAFAFRQSALAIGLGLVYVLVVEGLIFQLVGLAGGDTFRKIQSWFPAANTNGLAQAFGRAGRTGGGGPPALMDGTHAVIALLVYATAFAVASAIFLRSRDVA